MFEFTVLFFIMGSFFGSVLTLLIMRSVINKKLQKFYKQLSELQLEATRMLKWKRVKEPVKNMESYSDRLKRINLILTQHNDDRYTSYMDHLNELLKHHGIKNIKDPTIN